MLYLDTSAMVAAATIEDETGRVQDWMKAQAGSEFAYSDWVETEFSAALSIKLRRGIMTEADRDKALRFFLELAGSSFRRLPVRRSSFRSAARFADQFALGLRGGDALHLAIAAEHDAVLCTLDQKQAEAGPSLGLKTLSI